VSHYPLKPASYNVAVGASAGAAVTTGIQNAIFGGLAADSLTDADFNTAIGYAALTSDTLGSRSTAIGYNTLTFQNFTTATDSYNTAVGFDAGQRVTTGRKNTFVGALAGDASTTSSDNTAIGYAALSAVSGGTNTAVGSGALNVTTGFDNTALGTSAGADITSGDNNLALGHDALRSGSPGGPASTDNNVIGLGDENIASLHCQVALTVSSDQRDKTDFVGLDLGLDFVKALEPVTYYWDKRAKYLNRNNEDGTPNKDYDLDSVTPDGTHKEDWMDVGFKAQSVQALEEAAGYTSSAKKNLTVSVNSDGKQLGLRYEKFIPILVKAIQDQDAIITSLTARITALES
jgi:hypothetical protein